MTSIRYRFSKAANRSFLVLISALILKQDLINVILIISLSLDVTLIYLSWCYNRKPVIHSVLIMAEILLMRTKNNKAICVIRNAQVKCYSNTINLWKHLISRIRRHDFPQWMNEWRMAATHCLFTTHLLMRGQRSRCFHLLPSHYMMLLTNCCSESHFISILQFNLRKLLSYHMIHSSCKFLMAARQNKSLV